MISLLIPCYNESEVLRLTYDAVMESARSWGEAIELVLVDDGSSDDTWDIIQSLARRDPRVRGLRLSRNFGHQAAVGAGLEQAAGDAVIVLDADLQDPPELIPQMLAKWREGYDVVYAQRNRRQGESVFKRVAGNLFYRVLSRVNDVSIPRDTGDFALLDARVVRLLVQFKEHAVFWRGLRCWAGFRHAAVNFDRPGRAKGQTKYTLRKLCRLASDGILSFSSLPLRMGLYLGGAVLMGTMLALAGSLVYWLSSPAAEWPISAGVFCTLFLGGTQLLCLGVIGEYLNRIYDEARDRPRWIVESTVGIESANLLQERRKAS